MFEDLSRKYVLEPFPHSGQLWWPARGQCFEKAIIEHTWGKLEIFDWAPVQRQIPPIVEHVSFENWIARC